MDELVPVYVTLKLGEEFSLSPTVASPRVAEHIKDQEAEIWRLIRMNEKLLDALKECREKKEPTNDYHQQATRRMVQRFVAD